MINKQNDKHNNEEKKKPHNDTGNVTKMIMTVVMILMIVTEHATRQLLRSFLPWIVFAPFVRAFKCVVGHGNCSADTLSNHVQNFNRKHLADAAPTCCRCQAFHCCWACAHSLFQSSHEGGSDCCHSKIPLGGCRLLVQATNPHASPCNRKGMVLAPNARSDRPSPPPGVVFMVVEIDRRSTRPKASHLLAGDCQGRELTETTVGRDRRSMQVEEESKMGTVKTTKRNDTTITIMIAMAVYNNRANDQVNDSDGENDNDHDTSNANDC